MLVTLFTPHQGQEKIISGFADSNHKFGVVVTGRQFGKSLLGQNLLIYWLLQNPNQKGAWISPIYNQAKKVFQELTDASHQIIEHKNKADLTIKFMNGSTIQFLSAERPDSIRGFSFHYIIVDEAAFVKENAMTEAIFPTLTAIGKKCLMISTPKGRNWFYNVYLRGISDVNDQYISFSGTSFDSPYIDNRFLQEQERSLPRDIFRQEYWAEFTDASSDVFRGLENVCVLRNYESTKDRCFVGVDVGLQSDYTVVCVMSESGRICALDRFNGIGISEAADRVVQTLSRFHIQGGYVEVNGIGRGLYDLVKPKVRKIQAWTTSQNNKTQMVRKLIEDIEQMNVELPNKELSPELHEELSLYTYKISANGKMSFTHPTGHHDDVVDGLLMANEARHNLKSGGIYVGRGTKSNLNVAFGA
tara:strand:- start:8606 stop:9856 length:1251 start_codon:yes stop_codon:yes gene_type:complete